MSSMHFETALEIARGEYDQPTLRLEFGAAAMMQGILTRLFGNHELVYEGYTTQKIHQELIRLVKRQNLSDNFKEGIQRACEIALGELIADDQFLGDMKYWDSLSQGQRSAACDKTVQVLAKHVKRYAYLRPEELPRIEVYNQYFETTYIDINGNEQVCNPTVGSIAHHGKDCQHAIIINAHKKAQFNDPCHVIPSVIGEYISLMISDLQHVCHDYRHSPSIYEHDLQLLKAMDDEHALIIPYLDAVRSEQFSTRFINEIKTAASQSLSHAVEHKSGHIPERQQNRLGNRIKSVLGVLGL